MCTGCEPERGSSSVAISDRNHHEDGERVTAWSHSSRRMPDGMHEAAMSLALAMTVNDCVTVEKLYPKGLRIRHVVSIQFKVGQLLDPDSIHLGCQGSTSCTAARAGCDHTSQKQTGTTVLFVAVLVANRRANGGCVS